jgi:hypothetical protein
MFTVFPERDSEDNATGQWLWHLTGTNGEIVCQSEAYTREADAVRGVDDAVAAFADSVQPKIFNEPEEKP